MISQGYLNDCIEDLINKIEKKEKKEFDSELEEEIIKNLENRLY